METAWCSIGSNTVLTCLLGHPVRHSCSPAIQNAAFSELGVDMTYMAFDVAPEDLGDALGGLRALGFRGGNVTSPHKEAVLSLTDSLDDLAKRIGAVNTLVHRGGLLVGHNTDVYGFLMALELGWGRSPKGAEALVLGAGGAARAVVAALIEAEVATIHIYNRTYERGVVLCEDASLWGATRCTSIGEGHLREAAAGSDLIVNATSLGRGGGVKLSSLPVDIITDDHVVMDVNYGRKPTAFVQHAAEKGALAIDGREMLVQQAARSLELWTERRAPIRTMREKAEIC